MGTLLHTYTQHTQFRSTQAKKKQRGLFSFLLRKVEEIGMKVGSTFFNDTYQNSNQLSIIFNEYYNTSNLRVLLE